MKLSLFRPFIDRELTLNVVAVGKFFFICCLLIFSFPVSARYAAIVIDADTGRVVHEVEAAQRWYPASLTKVMTVYMALAALESGRLQLKEALPVSEHAAKQPPSKLGLRKGQTISLENAIMAAATRSANDAAVVLAERLGGTEANFAVMMTHQARTMGMNSSSFQNASGLPDIGQISSARDLALLSAALIRDFPQYYQRFFSAKEFVYKGRALPNINKILKTYPEADGLKTGFTCGSGYNLIASAKRGGHRLIGVLLGAHTSAERFQQMGNLLDLGFEKSQAGLFGPVVKSIDDSRFSPPPFQLNSKRCAGSAEHMGADVVAVAGKSEKIQIQSAKSQRQFKKQPLKTKAQKQSHGHAAAHNWAIMLGDHRRRNDAKASLKKVRRALGGGVENGKPQVVKQKINGKPFWRAEWMGLDEEHARAFCKKLKAKAMKCSLLPGNV